MVSAELHGRWRRSLYLQGALQQFTGLPAGGVQLHEKFYLMVLYGRNIICVLGKNMYFSVVEFCSVSFNFFYFRVVKIATYMDAICLGFALK